MWRASPRLSTLLEVGLLVNVVISLHWIPPETRELPCATNDALGWYVNLFGRFSFTQNIPQSSIAGHWGFHGSELGNDEGDISCDKCDDVLRCKCRNFLTQCLFNIWYAELLLLFSFF